jgi:nitrogen regulatory protein PII
MTHIATKVSIVTEKLIEKDIEKVVEQNGAKGYTVFEGSGKGSHGLKSLDRPSVVGAFALVKIEVIVADRAVADAIAEQVATTYFTNYSGIVYLEEVEILRREKF